MSVREQVHQIVDAMSEEQLNGFISLFGAFITISMNDEKTDKQRAYDELRKMIHPIPDIDYDKELAEYREEKYGK